MWRRVLSFRHKGMSRTKASKDCRDTHFVQRKLQTILLFHKSPFSSHMRHQFQKPYRGGTGITTNTPPSTSSLPLQIYFLPPSPHLPYPTPPPLSNTPLQPPSPNSLTHPNQQPQTPTKNPPHIKSQAPHSLSPPLQHQPPSLIPLSNQNTISSPFPQIFKKKARSKKDQRPEWGNAKHSLTDMKRTIEDISMGIGTSDFWSLGFLVNWVLDEDARNRGGG